LGSIAIRDGRLIWQPSEYAMNYLNLTEPVDCGPADQPESEQAIDDAFRRAARLRKQFRDRRKEEARTLSPEQLRQRRNAEIAERIVAAHRRQEEQAA
jgi:hypothetical protein